MPKTTMASAVLAVLSVAGAFTIGYTTAGIQVVAGIAVILDGVGPGGQHLLLA